MVCENPLVPTALQCHHAQTVKDSSFSYKIYYVIEIKNFLNPEGHQNPISGSIVTAILMKGWILPIAGASAVEGLRSTGLTRLFSIDFSFHTTYIIVCLSWESEEKNRLVSNCILWKID